MNHYGCRVATQSGQAKRTTGLIRTGLRSVALQLWPTHHKLPPVQAEGEQSDIIATHAMLERDGQAAEAVQLSHASSQLSEERAKNPRLHAYHLFSGPLTMLHPPPPLCV